jgi:iron-sulfur cluster assembly protein
MSLPFEISAEAEAEVLKIFKEKNIPQAYALRVGIKGGGCSGISYVFGFDQPAEHDLQYALGPLSVLVDKRHMLYIAGLKIGFENNADVYGFTFESPFTK